MKIKLFLLAIGIFLFTSCPSENQQTPPPNDAHPIEGLWNLVNRSGGLMGTNDNFEKGSITWAFSKDKLTVKQKHNNSEKTSNYSILEKNGNSYLVIDGKESGSISIKGNTMILNPNQGSEFQMADALVSRFER